MMKMNLLPSQDGCWKELTRVSCETNLGFVPFGSRCFLAVDEASMGQFASGASTADTAAAQIAAMVNAQLPPGLQVTLTVLPNAGTRPLPLPRPNPN